MPTRYRRLAFRVDAGDPELLAAALWEEGTLGFELPVDGDGELVIAYFAEGVLRRGVDWTAFGARLEVNEAFEELDWMAAYRAASEPHTIGRRLLVDPGEPELCDDVSTAQAGGPDRRRLRLPARTAFGTGSHASTRLVVELMEELDLEGRVVLDVGFGSGILSFAALLYGAARVVGVEVDLEAALVGAQNRRLNGLFPSLVAGGVAALNGRPTFDVALVNVLPERVAADLIAIRNLLRPRGTAIFSGILTELEGEIRGRLSAAGYRLGGAARTGDEWSALVVTREAGRSDERP